MALSRNAKRRLALYGGAAVVAALVVGGPRLVSLLSPGVKVRNLAAEADAGLSHEAVKLLVEFLRIDTANPPGTTRPAIEWLADRFGCEGIPYEVVGEDPDLLWRHAKVLRSDDGIPEICVHGPNSFSIRRLLREPHRVA